MKSQLFALPLVVLLYAALTVAAASAADETADRLRRADRRVRSAFDRYSNGKDSGSEENADNPAAAVDEVEDQVLAAAVQRRGFKNGGRDRFTHGFGRKRSESRADRLSTWSNANPGFPDRYSQDVLLDDEPSMNSHKRPIRSISRQRWYD